MAAYQEGILKPALEGFRTDGSLPDVFARYGLPLDVHDADTIDGSIDHVKAYWNRQKNNPNYRQMLGVLLDGAEIKRSRSILLDPTLRATERSAVEAVRRERMAAAERELGSFIQIVAVKGYRTPEETRRIVDRFRVRGFDPAEIEARFKVPLRDLAPRPPLDEGLPASVRDQIRKNLAVFRFKTLYDFIGVHPDGSHDEFQVGHGEKAEFWSRKPPNEAKAAAQALLGFVKTHLIAEDGDRYRAAVKWEGQEGLRSRVEVAAADKRIERLEFAELMRWALEQGLEASWAREFILSLAESFGAHVQWAEEAHVVCGNCSTASRRDGGSGHCPCCGEPLRIPCLHCGESMDTSQAACQACGHHFRAYVRLRSLTPMLEQALESGDLRAASDLVEQCRVLAPRGAEGSGWAQKFEARRGSLEMLRRSFEESLLTHLHAASEILCSLAFVAPDYVGVDGRRLADLEAALDERERLYRSTLAEAMRLGEAGRGDEAWIEFRRAAGMDAEAMEPQSLLSTCRPQPVSCVRLALHENGVHVAWSGSPSPGDLSYEVIRKVGSLPRDTSDGEVVVRTSRHEYLDAATQTGCCYGYSVVTVRCGAVSSPTASLEPILVLREVSTCEIVAGDREVRATWHLPAGARRVLVHRSQAELSSNDREAEIALADRCGFVDHGVENGVTYCYRIQVEYPDAEGSRSTAGIVVSARPEEAPRPVEHLVSEVQDSRILLSWAPPPTGDVRIYRSTAEPEWAMGTFISSQELAALAYWLEPGGSASAIDAAPLGGVSFWFPVTVLGSRAVVGRSLRIANLVDVRDVEVEDFGSYLQMRWRWPRSCTLARVAWRADRYPEGGEDADATCVDVSRGEYENRGGFRIPQPGEGPYWFTVYAAMIAGPDLVFSSGSREDCRATCRHHVTVPVRYSIRRRPLRREMAVCIDVDQGVACPDVVIVARQGTVQPLSREDGRAVGMCTGAQAGGRLREWPLDLSGLRHPVYLRAFFRSDEAYHRFSLIDPPVRELLYH